jgi:AraC-like DNA-binding protein
MDYREFAASGALTHVVDRIWTLTAAAGEIAGAPHVILPDGRPELVLHFGDAFERVTRGGRAKQPLTLFAGQLTEQLTLRATGDVNVLGVRFHSYGGGPVLRVPQQDLAGLTLDVADISPGLARSLRTVRDQTDDVNVAVPLVQSVLEKWIEQRAADWRVQAVTRRIVDSGGAVSIDRLAEDLSLTRRHLERLFVDAVGLPPKRLARITRFQRALRMLEQAEPRQRGVVTAAACGYADQSHFIREFRQLAGCSPSEHLLHHGEMTGFFIHSTLEI